MEGTKNFITASNLAGHTLSLHWMSGDEMLGGQLAGMFEYHLEVASPDAGIKAEDVLGQKLTIDVQTPDKKIRHFNGHVTSWSYGGLRHDSAIYHLTLHPWLWMLRFTSDCRIFNKKSVLEIVQRIFDKYPTVADYDPKRVFSEYPKHEYVVQYRESDFNLVCRLLQEEGLYFYFRHEAHKHTLVLAEGVTAHDPAPGYEKIPYMPRTTTAKQLAPHFDQCQLRQDIRVRAFAQLDYNFEKAKANMIASSEIAHDDPRFSIGEVFDYPGRYVDVDRGKHLAAVRLEGLHEASQVLQVEGNPWGLGAGNLVTLLNSPWSTAAADFLVTSAHYELKVPDEHSGGGGDAFEPFRARYTLQTKTDQFRPTRTARKPVLSGPQTAVVVGKKKTADPDPEEIETDPYGRVRVRFHWERIGDQHPDIRGKKDPSGKEDDISQEEDDTCYVRVAQLWAGNRWGAIYIPRIGHEVVVEFLEGDPDRPIITGSVYNNVNMPPYDLPKHMTQSGIKSRSTKGGTAQNFNEIRFEDLKGKEELHIQAEKDMSTLVKNCQSTDVGGNRTVTVHGKQTTEVTKEEKQTYHSSRTMEVTAIDTDIYHGGRDETVENGDTLTVNASDKDITVHGTFSITADTEYRLTQAGNHITLKDPDITITNGQCTIKLSKGAVNVTAADSINLTCGSSSINMLSSGSIEVKGSTGVSVIGGGEVVATPSGVDIKGPKVDVTGSGPVSITGAIVKVNG